jgi:transposase
VIPAWEAAGESAMMGRQDRDQGQLFYEFSLDEMIPADHLLRRINGFATAVLADLHEQLKAFYSDIGRPSIDPELMIRMLLAGYCYGIRHERRLCQEVALHLAYRWFCKLDPDDKVPHHLTFLVNRLGRFRESEILRHIFERVVAACMAAGLVKGEGFAVDASVIVITARRIGEAVLQRSWETVGRSADESRIDVMRNRDPIAFLQRRSQALAQRSADLDKLAEAWQPLYNTLSKEQRQRMAALAIFVVRAMSDAVERRRAQFQDNED